MIMKSLKNKHPFLWRFLSDIKRFFIKNDIKPKSNPVTLADYEEKIYSQNGEDGVIMRLIELYRINGKKEITEIGIEDGRECNSRNLIYKGWSARLIECAPIYVKLAKKLYKKYPVKVIEAFVNAENVNNFIGDPDILSIDIDGMDYWVWKAVKSRPKLVIIEYNSNYGYEKEKIVPYEPDFNRFRVDSTGKTFGASYQSYKKLGEEKGYELVYRDSTETNLFFIKK